MVSVAPNGGSDLSLLAPANLCEGPFEPHFAMRITCRCPRALAFRLRHVMWNSHVAELLGVVDLGARRLQHLGVALQQGGDRGGGRPRRRLLGEAGVHQVRHALRAVVRHPAETTAAGQLGAAARPLFCSPRQQSLNTTQERLYALARTVLLCHSGTQLAAEFSELILQVGSWCFNVVCLL
jgi:hypothetical protein